MERKNRGSTTRYTLLGAGRKIKREKRQEEKLEQGEEGGQMGKQDPVHSPSRRRGKLGVEGATPLKGGGYKKKRRTNSAQDVKPSHHKGKTL